MTNEQIKQKVEDILESKRWNLDDAMVNALVFIYKEGRMSKHQELASGGWVHRFNSEEEFLEYLKMKREYEQLREDYNLLESKYSELVAGKIIEKLKHRPSEEELTPQKPPKVKNPDGSDHIQVG